MSEIKSCNSINLYHENIFLRLLMDFMSTRYLMAIFQVFLKGIKKTLICSSWSPNTITLSLDAVVASYVFTMPSRGGERQGLITLWMLLIWQLKRRN